MALLQELIQQIEDPVLRDRLTSETDKLLKQKKFGLVFEEHLPECTPLYEIPIRVGGMVAKKNGYVRDYYFVKELNGDNALCINRETREESVIPLTYLVTVAQFGEPIYPYLKPVDTVCNAPDSDLWHTLIEADNYHALQLLEYLYAGKVDCIYIDPPYNTGAKDWKYNNDYVDGSDTYRHSKWLSFMEKRLKLARKLLNPEDSVLIVTIDEKEYLHLGCLLEELFPEATIQMIADVINPGGTNRENEFSRVEEYLFICRFGDCSIIKTNHNMLGNTDETNKARVWYSFNRGNNLRSSANNQFFPIYIDPNNMRIVEVGEPLNPTTPRSEFPKHEGLATAFPINDKGNECIWRGVSKTIREWAEKGYIRVSKYDDKLDRWTLLYIPSGLQKRIESGEIKVSEKRADGSLDIEHISSESELVAPRTVWFQKMHNATDYGASILKSILPNRTFLYPKSLYSVKDAISFFISKKPNALVLDFFAGSGTTLQAVNLLNAEDNGRRRCVLVTNNEVSVDEAKTLKKHGHNPGDSEWEKMGIAQYITWPRTVSSIKGCDVNENSLDGEYLSTRSIQREKKRSFTQIKFVDDIMGFTLSDKKQFISLISNKILPQALVTADSKYIVSEESDHTVSILLDATAADEWLEALEGMTHITDFYIITKSAKLFKELKAAISELLGNIIIEEPLRIPMSEGFKANAAFFKLGFLDKTRVALGVQFKELLPVLWMKANAIGACPTLEKDSLPNMLILPQNHFAVLLEESSFKLFSEELANHPEIDTVFIVTDSINAYREMIRNMNEKQTHQLYRDYLDNFRINVGR